MDDKFAFIFFLNQGSLSPIFFIIIFQKLGQKRDTNTTDENTPNTSNDKLEKSGGIDSRKTKANTTIAVSERTNNNKKPPELSTITIKDDTPEQQQEEESVDLSLTPPIPASRIDLKSKARLDMDEKELKKSLEDEIKAVAVITKDKKSKDSKKNDWDMFAEQDIGSNFDVRLLCFLFYQSFIKYSSFFDTVTECNSC